MWHEWDEQELIQSPLRRPRRRWVDLVEIGQGWIGVAQDWDKWGAFANTEMNLLVP
jgi:hypothetical protein